MIRTRQSGAPPRKPNLDPPGGQGPVFGVRTVQPQQRSSSWITLSDDDVVDDADLIDDEDLLDDDSSPKIVKTRSKARPIVVRIVGYLLIGLLFWGTARLVARRPFREAILEWTTFGLTRYVRAATARVADLVHRLKSH